jgi:hypothetical protein
MSGHATARRLRQQSSQERLAALAGCILGCGVRTGRQEQQEVRQEQDGGNAAESEQAQPPSSGECPMGPGCLARYLLK